MDKLDPRMMPGFFEGLLGRPKGLYRAQPGQTVEPEERDRGSPDDPPSVGLLDRLLGLGEDMGDMTDQALRAAQDAYEQTMLGASRAGTATMELAEEAAASARDAYERTLRGFEEKVAKPAREGWMAGRENFYQKLENDRLGQMGLPPVVPRRSPSDPYYGYQWPFLARRRPGQLWYPPDQPPPGLPTWDRERGWINPGDPDYPGQQPPGTPRGRRAI